MIPFPKAGAFNRFDSLLRQSEFGHLGKLVRFLELKDFGLLFLREEQEDEDSQYWDDFDDEDLDDSHPLASPSSIYPSKSRRISSRWCMSKTSCIARESTDPRRRRSSESTTGTGEGRPRSSWSIVSSKICRPSMCSRFVPQCRFLGRLGLMWLTHRRFDPVALASASSTGSCRHAARSSYARSSTLENLARSNSATSESSSEHGALHAQPLVRLALNVPGPPFPADIPGRDERRTIRLRAGRLEDGGGKIGPPRSCPSLDTRLRLRTRGDLLPSALPAPEDPLSGRSRFWRQLR